MKALEFEAKLGADANLSVPADLALQIPKEAPVRVIILVPERAEDESWSLLTHEQFLRGYSDSDSVYDGV